MHLFLGKTAILILLSLCLAGCGNDKDIKDADWDTAGKSDSFDMQTHDALFDKQCSKKLPAALKEVEALTKNAPEQGVIYPKPIRDEFVKGAAQCFDMVDALIIQTRRDYAHLAPQTKCKTALLKQETILKKSRAMLDALSSNSLNKPNLRLTASKETLALSMSAASLNAMAKINHTVTCPVGL